MYTTTEHEHHCTVGQIIQGLNLKDDNITMPRVGKMYISDKNGTICHKMSAGLGLCQIYFLKN